MPLTTSTIMALQLTLYALNNVLSMSHRMSMVITFLSVGNPIAFKRMVSTTTPAIGALGAPSTVTIETPIKETYWTAVNSISTACATKVVVTHWTIVSTF